MIYAQYLPVNSFFYILDTLYFQADQYLSKKNHHDCLRLSQNHAGKAGETTRHAPTSEVSPLRFLEAQYEAAEEQRPFRHFNVGDFFQINGQLAIKVKAAEFNVGLFQDRRLTFLSFGESWLIHWVPEVRFTFQI